MADAVLIQVADALVADLNAAAFSPPFTAVRRLVPQWTLAELETLRVTVVPGAVRHQLADRGRAACEYEVEVGVEKKIREEADAGPLLALLEAVADRVRGRSLALADGQAALWLRTDIEPAFAPEHLEELRLYTGVLVVTYRVVR